jgi:hypothetical protein
MPAPPRDPISVVEHHFEARLEQQLLHERIADLHRRSLLGALVVELGRGHGRAVDAVASGLGADVIDGIADARCHSFDDVRRLGDAETEDVDQRIAGVARIEADLAADGRNPDAVAVAGDAGDDTFEQPPGARLIQRTEAQRVQQGDRPGAHGENIADDAADAGRGALIRLDERRVIVRFDLEDRGKTVTDVHRAGILAGPLDDLRPFGGQSPQIDARALVAAVLRPHHREDPKLGQVRIAPEKGDDPFVLVRLDAVALENLRVDHDAGDPVERTNCAER